MSIKTEFILEMRKLRRRHIPLLFLMIFALITAWTCWCMDDLDITRLNDASAMLFTNLLLMNTILCPIVLAALASRMCDMEQMGNTYKWICTMQKPEHVYRGKAAAGSFYIILFALMQTLLFLPTGGGAGAVVRRAGGPLSLLSAGGRRPHHLSPGSNPPSGRGRPGPAPPDRSGDTCGAGGGRSRRGAWPGLSAPVPEGGPGGSLLL